MIQTQLTITQKTMISPAWWQFQAAATSLAPPLEAGQFLLVRCADHLISYLRRPLFPAPVDETHLSFWLRPSTDAGLAWLLSRQKDDSLDVIGPLGNAFPRHDDVRNLLLVSDTPNVGPLLGLMTQGLQRDLSVTLALGSLHGATLYPVSALPPTVELQAATLDGTLGHRGPITDLLPALLGWADLVCAAGTLSLYRALREQTRAVRFGTEMGFCYGLFSEYALACGVGSCLSCTLDTTSGLKLACVDGPVFDLAEVWA